MRGACATTFAAGLAASTTLSRTTAAVGMPAVSTSTPMRMLLNCPQAVPEPEN